MNKFKKIKFLRSFDVDDIIEQDLIYGYWDLFKIKRPVTYFTLTKEHIGRPDLLCIVLYGVMKYWSILLNVNDIHDPWNDMKVGDVIIVPDILDYEDWLAEVVAIKRNESQE